MNGGYQILNFDDIAFESSEPELVVGAYDKIKDTSKRFVITRLNLDEASYKDVQLTFIPSTNSFIGTGLVNGKLLLVSIANTNQVTVSLVDLAGDVSQLKEYEDITNDLTINEIFNASVSKCERRGNVISYKFYGKFLSVPVNAIALVSGFPNVSSQICMGFKDTGSGFGVVNTVFGYNLIAGGIELDVGQITEINTTDFFSFSGTAVIIG